MSKEEEKKGKSNIKKKYFSCVAVILIIFLFEIMSFE